MKALKIALIFFATLIFGLLLGVAFFYVQQSVNRQYSIATFFIDPDLSKYINQDAAVCRRQKKSKVVGGIVNHHLLAADLMKNFFCRVASNDVGRVIVISPNHFGRGSGWAVVSVNNWRIIDELLLSDDRAISRLIENSNIKIDNSVFLSEHGIGNLLAAVKYYLPRAKIVAIAVKDNMPESEQQLLIDKLSKIIDDKTIVIASLDFSHNLPLAEAQANDEKTLAVIKNLDNSGVKNLNQEPAGNVDSLPALAVFLKLMKAEGANNFELLGHDNSAVISGQLSASNTTSYFTAVYQRKK